MSGSRRDSSTIPLTFVWFRRRRLLHANDGMTGTATTLEPAAETSDPALQLLLTSNEPAIWHAALGDLLDRPAADPDVRAARAAIARGPLVAGLLSGQRQDGGFGVHPYAKWAGAHWRLVSLMDLGVPPETAGFRAAAETVLDWLCGGHALNTPVIRGLARKCASQDGNGLAVPVYLGLAEDPRVEGIASRLMSWQWPDGLMDAAQGRAARTGWRAARTPASSASHPPGAEPAPRRFRRGESPNPSSPAVAGPRTGRARRRKRFRASLQGTPPSHPGRAG